MFQQPCCGRTMLILDDACKTTGWAPNISSNGSVYGESVLQRFLDEVANTSPSSCVLDVGANIGIFTLATAALFPEKRIFAFEPVGATFGVLGLNLAHNHATAVTPMRMALSDESQAAAAAADIRIPAGGSHFGLVTLAQTPLRFNEYETESVPVSSIDALCFGTAVGAIKIATQGWEYQVLMGALNTIRRDAPIILLEHEEVNARQCGGTLARVRALLSSLGYAWERVGNDHIIAKRKGGKEEEGKEEGKQEEGKGKGKEEKEEEKEEKEEEKDEEKEVAVLSFATPSHRSMQKRQETWFREQWGAWWWKAVGNEYIDVDFARKNATLLAQQNRGGGYWAWKPCIIDRFMREECSSEFVLYIDASSTLKKTQRELVDAMRGRDVLLWLWNDASFQYCAGVTEGMLTKGDVFAAFSKSAQNEEDAKQLQFAATAVCLRRNSPVAREFVRKWLQMVQEPGLVDDTPSKAPNHPSFVDHRHDQSIASFLFRDMGNPPLLWFHDWIAHHALGYR